MYKSRRLYHRKDNIEVTIILNQRIVFVCDKTQMLVLYYITIKLFKGVFILQKTNLGSSQRNQWISRNSKIRWENKNNDYSMYFNTKCIYMPQALFNIIIQSFIVDIHITVRTTLIRNTNEYKLDNHGAQN